LLARSRQFNAETETGSLAVSANKTKIMGKKLTADQLQLYKGIDEILWKDWDPIGVSPDGPRDEYHTYLPQVFRLALEDAAPQKIAEYLHKVVSERMGLTSHVAYHLPIAQKIRTLKLQVMPEK
jgi:hypothetical protein